MSLKRAGKISTSLYYVSAIEFKFGCSSVKDLPDFLPLVLSLFLFRLHSVQDFLPAVFALHYGVCNKR